MVSILEQRHLLLAEEDKCSNKIKLSFEKIVGDEPYERISTSVISRQELKDLLNEFLKEDEIKSEDNNQ